MFIYIYIENYFKIRIYIDTYLLFVEDCRWEIESK